MVAIGVWHGPRWTYAAFGAIHGVMLAVSALTLKSRNGYFRRHPEFAGIRAVVGPVVTFHLVVLPMIVFRSDSVASALVYFRNLVPGLAHSDIPALRVGSGFLHFNPATLLLIVVAIVVAELADGVVRRGPATPGPFWSAPRAFRWAIYYAGASPWSSSVRTASRSSSMRSSEDSAGSEAWPEFLRRLALFIAPLLAVFALLEWGLAKAPNAYTEKRDLLARKGASIETLIVGSSNGFVGIAPHLLSRPALNLAYSAETLYYTNRVFAEALSRCPHVKKGRRSRGL